MQPITVSTTVSRPREELYALLADLRRHEAFTDHFLVDWSGTADHVRFRSNLPGPADWAEVTLVEQHPPERLVERTVAAGGKRVLVGTYRLTARPDGGTDVRFEAVFEQTPLRDRLAAPLAHRWLVKQNARAMERLKALAEGAVATAA